MLGFDDYTLISGVISFLVQKLGMVLAFYILAGSVNLK
jgi:hypothetical protein